MEQDTNNIKISSADGWNEIEFRPVSAKDDLCFEILAKGRFWEKCQEFQIESAQLADDFSLSFLHVPLSRERLIAFSELLEAWQVEPSEIRVELTSSGNPNISIFIGETDEMISSATKPVFIFRYKDSRIETNIKFVTDQSCLNLMLQDLKRLLR
jgi:hypothetical protein